MKKIKTMSELLRRFEEREQWRKFWEAAEKLPPDLRSKVIRTPDEMKAMLDAATKVPV